MISLILGGVRSGKSELAERLVVASGQDVVYVATARTEASMSERIDAHQARRPAAWDTILCHGSDLVEVIRSDDRCLLVDSLGSWLASHDDLDADVEALVAAMASRPSDAVVVSEEVGLSVHPETSVGRLFQDRLGELNRLVAGVADRSLLVVAGRVLSLGSSIDEFD